MEKKQIEEEEKTKREYIKQQICNVLLINFLCSELFPMVEAMIHYWLR